VPVAIQTWHAAAVTAIPTTSIDLNEKIGTLRNKWENEREKESAQLA